MASTRSTTSASTGRTTSSSTSTSRSSAPTSRHGRAYISSDGHQNYLREGKSPPGSGGGTVSLREHGMQSGRGFYDAVLALCLDPSIGKLFVVELSVSSA